MIKEGKFGVQEATCLVSITICAKVFFTSPAFLVDFVGNAGWLMTLISAITAAIGFTIVYLLLKQFPKEDLTQIFHTVLGPIFGFAFSIIIGLSLFFIAAIRIREFTEVLAVYIFPLTPIWFMICLFIVGIFTLSILGLETIARYAKLSAYFLLLGFIIILLLGNINYNTNHLFPIFGYGIDKILSHGFIRGSAYVEIILLAVFAKSLQGVEHIKKAGYTSLFISGSIISISLFTFSLTFPHYVAREITAPIYEMAALIDYGKFIQRIETIFLFIWIISTFISVTALFYAFVSIYCKIFKIEDPRPIILGSIIILFAASMIEKDIISIIAGNVQRMMEYGMIPIFILPLITLIVSKFKKKGYNSNA